MDHFYIIYKIINKVNKKFYIGVHKTNNINDDYYGSGHLIKAAIKKYGVENFEKQILNVFTKRKDAFAKEKELVTDKIIKSPQCYNIKLGGNGGFDFIQAKKLHKSSKGKKIIYNPITNQQTKIDPIFLDKYIKQGWKLGFRPSSLKKMSESGKIKIQSPEQRGKNSQSKIDCQIMRVPGSFKGKFIKNSLVNSYLKNGWEIYDRGKKYWKKQSI
jgi:GIY-YIG catalytic domain